MSAVKAISAEPTRVRSFSASAVLFPADKEPVCARFLVQLAILALEIRGDHRGAVTIPEGVILEGIGSSETDPKFFIVEVEGHRFEVFESDLKSRCKERPLLRVKSAGLSG
jgi:hypothetical protein